MSCAERKFAKNNSSTRPLNLCIILSTFIFLNIHLYITKYAPLFTQRFRNIIFLSLIHIYHFLCILPAHDAPAQYPVVYDRYHTLRPGSDDNLRHKGLLREYRCRMKTARGLRVRCFYHREDLEHVRLHVLQKR